MAGFETALVRGGAGSCAISMSGDAQVTATFAVLPPPPPPPAMALITLNTTGTGKGRVTSSPAGIDCPAACTMSVPVGTVVSLTEQPDASSDFAGWGGACSGAGACAFAAAAAQTVWANFAAKPPPAVMRMMAVSVTGGGAVTSAPAGISCPGTCAASFAEGTTVAFVAAPGAGDRLVAWSGACTGNGACAVTMNADAQLSAQFEQDLPADCKGVVPGALPDPVSAETPHGAGQECWSATSDGDGFVASEAHTPGQSAPYGLSWSIFGLDGKKSGTLSGGFELAPEKSGFDSTRIFFPMDPPPEVVFSHWAHDGSETKSYIGSDACGPAGAYRVAGGGAIALTICGNGVLGALMVYRFDGSGHRNADHTGAIGLNFSSNPKQMFITAAGDAGGHALVIVFPGSVAGLGGDDYAARWFAPDGQAETAVFSAGRGSGEPQLRALIGGGLALQIGGAWTAVFAAGSTAAQAVPGWLAAHANFDLETIRGGSAYALVPLDGAGDRKTLQFYSAAGNRCGATAFPVGGLTVGFDGTVIGAGGDAGCTHTWWHALLR